MLCLYLEVLLEVLLFADTNNPNSVETEIPMDKTVFMFKGYMRNGLLNG